MSGPKIVTAALIYQNGQILAARRPAQDHLALLWEFPGGKLEPGETEPECLAREIREELGVKAIVGSFFERSHYTYAGGEIELAAYWVAVKSAEFRIVFHHSVRWCDRASLAELAFAPADIPIVRRLIEAERWGD